MSTWLKHAGCEYLLLVQVVEEVLLGLELPGQLLRGDVAQGTLL